MHSDRPARTASRALVPILIAATVAVIGAGTSTANQASTLAAGMPQPFFTQLDGASDFVTAFAGPAISTEGPRIRLKQGRRQLELNFEGASHVTPVGADRKPGVANFLLGDDPSTWRMGLPTYGALRYEELYDGVDAEITFTGDGKLQARFIGESSRAIQAVAPAIIGRDLAEEHVVQDLAVKPQADRVGLVGRVLQWVKPTHIAVATLDYGTYLGGTFDDVARSVAVNQAGEAILVGSTASANFPIANALQPDPGSTGGDFDAFIAKLNAAGDTLLYSTFLGGNEQDGAYGVDLDAAGNVYLAGYTRSGNFPTANPIQAANAQRGKSDAFITKIDPAGANLLYSTYLGGTGDDPAFDIAVGPTGEAHIVGTTDSSNFPTAHAVQSGRRGSFDAFVARVNSAGDALLYSSYLGGNGDEEAYGVAADAMASYITGFTDSVAFPTVDAFQRTRGGGNDAFVARVEVPVGETDAVLAWSSYLGGNQEDSGNAIDLQPDGAVVVVGSTSSSNFPVARSIQNHRAGSDMFLTRIAQPTRDQPLAAQATIDFSTYFGGQGVDVASDVTVGIDGLAYLAGSSDSPNMLTENAFQGSRQGGVDAYAGAIDMNAAALRFGTYVGGSSSDAAHGIAVGTLGIYVVGETTSSNFPNMDPVGSRAGNSDAFALRFGPDAVPPLTPGTATNTSLATTAVPTTPPPTTPPPTGTTPNTPQTPGTPDTPETPETPETPGTGSPTATSTSDGGTDTPTATETMPVDTATPTATETLAVTVTATATEVSEFRIYLPWVNRP